MAIGHARIVAHAGPVECQPMLLALIIAWVVILVVGSAVAGIRAWRVMKRAPVSLLLRKMPLLGVTFTSDGPTAINRRSSSDSS